MNYTLSYPALNGQTITEGHAQYCRDNGHAVHTVDGVKSTLCPRCGAIVRNTIRTGDVVRNIATGNRVHVRHYNLRTDTWTLELLGSLGNNPVFTLSDETVQAVYEVISR